MTADELIEQGQHHQDNGDHAAAIAAYERAFELAPGDWRLPSEVGRLALYLLSDGARAAAAYEAALPLIEDELVARETRYHLGVAHTFANADDRAAARFEEVLAHTPTHVLACIELGKVLTRAGDHARAKDLLQQAVLHNDMRSTMPEMFPDGQRGSRHAAALAWLNFGRLAIATDNPDDADLAGLRLAQDLHDWNRVVMLTREAHAAGQLEAAISFANALLGTAPSNPEDEAHYEAALAIWLAIVLDEQELYDWAIERAVAAVDADPAWSRRLVAEVLRRRPEHAEALALKQRLDAGSP